MLERLRARFATDSLVDVITHDMDQSLPDAWGAFDAIVSSFAIHHLVHDRKRALYEEVFRRLAGRRVHESRARSLSHRFPP